MAYQNNNKPAFNKNNTTYGKGAAPAAPAKKESDEKPVGSLQQVIPGDREKGEKDTYLDIGGLWVRTAKKDGRKFYVARGMNGTNFEGVQFIVTLRE